MDWERWDLGWSERDFGFFQYGDGESLAIRKLTSDEVGPKWLQRIDW
jgi:hypothetical protein